VRRKFEEFVFRYRPLDLQASKDHITLCTALEKKGLLKPRQWAIGHTKVFMRNLQQQELEEARENSLMTVVTKMTTIARRFLCRCHYIRYKAILVVIKGAVTKRTEEALEAALTDVSELPFGGEHVPIVKEARRLKERLEDERRVTQMCKDAIKSRDLNELKGACKAADDIVFVTPVVTEAKALRDLMEKEKAAVKRLKDACTARTLDEIVAALAHGDTLGSFVTQTDTYHSVSALHISHWVVF
jgi:myosin heavy subunit